jgi:hypothetical protein
MRTPFKVAIGVTIGAAVLVAAKISSMARTGTKL